MEEKIQLTCPFSFSPSTVMKNNPIIRNGDAPQIITIPWGIGCVEAQCKLWLNGDCSINVIAKLLGAVQNAKT